MAARKISAPSATKQDVDRKLFELGRVELELDALEAQMNQRLDAVKQEYAKRLQVLALRVTGNTEALYDLLRQGRRALFPDKAKSLHGLFGKCGFRKTRGSVSVAKGTSEEEAVRLLEQNVLHHLVRIRKEVNKDGIVQRLADAEITEEQLHRCGVVIKKAGEKPWYKVDHPSVKDELEKRG